jgi:DNA-binding GntR family transcriptional regulator
LDRIGAHDAAGAAEAMSEHLSQTAQDLLAAFSGADPPAAQAESFTGGGV